MNHKMFEKRCRYSIRKFAIGAASVMIGASLFGVQLAHAAETEAPTSEEEVIHQVEPLDKLPEDVAAAISKADQTPSPAPSTEEATEHPKPSSETADATPLAPKVETPTSPADSGNGKAEAATPKPSLDKALEPKPDTAVMPDKNEPEGQAGAKEAASNTTKPELTKDKETEDRLLQERKQNFNKEWYFKLNTSGDFSKKEVDVHDWSKLNLPHDWSIYFDFDHQSHARNEGGQLNGGTAWYRKTFTVNEADKNKDVRLTFDGVYMDSKVFVNGKFVGNYPSGYNHFS